MRQEGKYVYCIIDSNDGRNFGSIGIGSRGDVVSTIGYKDISAVISNTPMSNYVISSENLTDHEKVVEKVMEDHTVLPIRFCTIASSVDEIRTLLRRRYSEFKNLLRDLDNKIEMGLKVFWMDMEKIFSEIANKDDDVTDLKKRSALKKDDESLKMALGKAVKSVLTEKKNEESFPIFNKLRRISFKAKEKDLKSDEMVLNAAFLIDRKFEKEFDFFLEEMSQEHKLRFRFKYVGPSPAYNFVNLNIKS